MKNIDKKQLLALASAALVILDHFANLGFFDPETTVKLLAITSAVSALLPKLFGEPKE